MAVEQSIFESLKESNGNLIPGFIKSHINEQSTLVDLMSSLGKLPKGFDLSWAVSLLNHHSEDVRLWAVKTVGKEKKESNIPALFECAQFDSSTMVRREAVSSIGRLHSEKSIPVLTELLKAEDPKIVCQAIRGLLVFKGQESVDTSLKGLKNHPNEMVSAVINKEYFVEKKKKESHQPHPESFDYLKNVAVNGDVLEVLKSVPDESVHLTFTSPPYYNARDYSIYESYEAYLDFLESVFKATYRITKEGRFLIINTSPVIVPRISRAHSSKRYAIPFDMHPRLLNMGWEFIDDIIWEKPEFSVKNRIGGFQQHRKPLGYKPNSVTEYLMVYRKATDKLLDWNIHQYNKEIIADSLVPEGYETTNVWKINPRSDKVHSAIFPEELCERVISYYSYKGDLIFEPFGGSGTLGRVAKRMGRYFFMTEKEPTYFEYMKRLDGDTIFSENRSQYLTLKEFNQSH